MRMNRRLIGLTLALALALAGVITAAPAHAHGHTATMPLNVIQYNTTGTGCNYKITHGNVYATAYAKVYMQNRACGSALVLVTGCWAPYQCADGNWAGGAPYIWHQSTRPWSSVIYSHFYIRNVNTGLDLHLHRNVF